MVLEKRLAAPIIILLYGKKKNVWLVCISLAGHSWRGRCKAQDAAVVHLQRSVSGELYLLEHLHVVSPGIKMNLQK